MVAILKNFAPVILSDLDGSRLLSNCIFIVDCSVISEVFGVVSH